MRTVTELASALRAGEVTSVDLTEQALAAADRLDGTLGVYLARFDEQALAAARRADKELADGVDLGPLHGIPVGVKDSVSTSDGPTTAQSLVRDPHWDTGRDALVVAQLRAAGAVITGKTTLMEFGFGVPDPAKPFPIPRNPWDTRAWTGGSSSGSAGGVAAGLFAAAIGSDTGGSIRMPAAFCGITGLMPTHGLVPTSGCVPLSYSMDRVGPLARSARDCAAMLTVMAGPRTEQPLFDADLSGLRVGAVRAGHFPDGTDPALPGAFDRALAALADLGASIVEVSLPYLAEMATVAYVTVASEGFAYHRDDLSARWHDYFTSTRGLLALGALSSGADYVQAQRLRQVARSAVARLFADVDVIVSPTASIGAPLFDEFTGSLDSAAVFPLVHTLYWSTLGNPVLAVPIGFTARGLPLSCQIAGPAFGEARILRVGDAFQQDTDWHLRTPPNTPGTDPVARHAPAHPPIVDTQALRTLLAAAGLPDSADADVAFDYHGYRAAVDDLYAVTATRYAEPVLQPRELPRL
nr:amidase [Kibdelosporangium sp. MJ126-NF4]CEL23027.1 Aspartyl-tRNA(Asn) amidotransferase subunit A @ Glutamyl-tRNA(Gln) amidotransferase subunit A [Kibdelosporangium sp. MJ126-NF4]CTQ90166.1 Aspartyl-tRNA(Asn) amidotransferase subunit A (EC 6.3.5.6) @ Glutamyl-tRNA(Gln) amidotransferase subunit A (EC 6.3.5.7) [Kibdelosporangium sp. MJ126-NF4]